MKFKSIEDNLKETGYKLITAAENSKDLFIESSKMTFKIAGSKYKNCAIVPISILLEGDRLIEENRYILYGLPPHKKHPSNAWYYYFYSKKAKEVIYLQNENDFKAKIQTRHPYQSWHEELKKREFSPYCLGEERNIAHVVSNSMSKIAEHQASEIIILPTSIAFEGEKWVPEEKLTSAVYLKKINDLKDNSIEIKRYIFAEKKSGNLEFMDFS